MKRRTINKQYHRRHPTRRANGVYAMCGRTVEEFVRGGNIGHDKQTYSAKPHGYTVFESLQEATEWRRTTMKIRRRRAGVRYCERITEEHKTISRSLWHKRLVDAANRVETAPNRPGNIDDWTEMTRARLNFAHIWYKHKLRYDRVTAEDIQAYIVMTTV